MLIDKFTGKILGDLFNRDAAQYNVKSDLQFCRQKKKNVMDWLLYLEIKLMAKLQMFHKGKVNVCE